MKEKTVEITFKREKDRMDDILFPRKKNSTFFVAINPD